MIKNSLFPDLLKQVDIKLVSIQKKILGMKRKISGL